MKTHHNQNYWTISLLIAIITTLSITTADAVAAGGTSRRAAAPSQPPPQEIQASDLFKVVDTNPKVVSRISFASEENPKRSSCIAEFTNGARRIAILPDGAADDLRTRAIKGNIAFVALPQAGHNETTPWLMPALIIGGCIVVASLITRKGMKSHAANKKIRSITFKSLRSDKKLTWDDIGGCDEAVGHFKRIARWAQRREFYRKHQARMPKGFLLKGPPGTGKTLLARVLCSELDGEGIVVSGSDFVELFVGVGASRIRDIFQPARAYVRKTGKPYIVFIDEIDAVGGKRNEQTHDEKTQTLNALLVEIDGMLADEGIIVIGATNRPDMLDAALLRPGRLEYHVEIGLPDITGRAAILTIHTRDKKLAEGVTAEVVARETYGMSGADLAMVINTAAMAAADRCITAYEKAHPQFLQPQPKRGVCPFEIPAADEDEVDQRKEVTDFEVVEITHADIDQAVEDLHLGEKMVSKQASMRLQDKQETVNHETGHAVVLSVFPFMDPISLVSAQRRSKTLGVVVRMPDYEKVSRDKKSLLADIVCCMAGRCAQMDMTGTSDTGALGDYRQATDAARRMVMDWGMSKVGKFGVGKREDGTLTELSEAMKAKIDEAWLELLEQCEATAKLIIEKEKARMIRGAAELFERETIAGRDWRQLMESIPSEVVWTELPLFKEFADQKAA